MDFDKARSCEENQEVMRIASQRFKIPKEDKNQCKLLGLWDAVKLYDENRGVPFKLFLSLRVKFRCLKYCNENYDSRIKYLDTNEVYNTNNIVEILESRMTHPMRKERKESCINNKKNIYSFGQSLMRKSCKKSKNEEFLTDVLLSCSKDEQELINKRFLENRTLQDIGTHYNVTYETIRKRINLILEKFKD